jgi:pimeloyl-ACP methyl ester carboxylesterase
MRLPPDVLLLHGALGAGRQMEPLAAALGEYCRVHRMDFEGHGDAPFRDRPFRMEHFPENVRERLDALELRSACIFGYSMGGYVALQLALALPERVERIATLGTKFRWDAETATAEGRRLDPVKIRAKVPHFADVLEERHRVAGGWEHVLARTADLLRDLGDNPRLTDRELARIAHPVCVCVGEKDTTVGMEETSAVAGTLPSGTLCVLPDTPHPIEQVRIDLLAPILLDFFC